MATTTMNSSVLGSAANSGRGFETVRAFFEIAGAAIRCAAAVEAGYRPKKSDLNTLGIGDSLNLTDYKLGR